MSDSKFTSGRWVWKYENLYSEIDGEKDKPVLVTDYDVPERTAEDSSLIAAAPDLYEALDSLASIMETDERSYVVEAVCSARAALAKARGETP